MEWEYLVLAFGGGFAIGVAYTIGWFWIMDRTR